MSAKGYAIHDTNNWSDFKLISYDLKTAEDYDIDIAITHCGICGSDLHTIRGGWHSPDLPLVAGHEIVGEVTRVGPKVTEFKVGDRAGVGAQVSSCFDCSTYYDGLNVAQLIPDQKIAITTTRTTVAKWWAPTTRDTPTATRYTRFLNSRKSSLTNVPLVLLSKATGGYATAIRVHERFVFPIPDKLASDIAAPMLCAGLTTYSALVRYGCGPGKKVGVVGIGGLGHFAIMWAKALGAEVYALTRNSRKDEDIKKLGADHILYTEEEDFTKSYEGEMDIIISVRFTSFSGVRATTVLTRQQHQTISVSAGIPIRKILSLLAVNGHLVCAGLPDEPLPQIAAFDLLVNGCALAGSHIGSKKEVVEMLKLASEQDLRSWIEVLPMSKLKEGVEKVERGDVRYRVVLENDIEA
ncbi:hypothetical protein EW146_g7746 [Bondarzewia mesenterica]|uniref:Enoyl reductase (ER) domain-containing protein n=1 Tax=Bondarzewia mesenterica TaxID=1095465 RepID=A0A4S4LLJ1_9AGAM|nr:hypothetical protein EW146_g7746 [Bondarzewia mesenterica]